jgi:hypothetical protein
VSDTRNAIERQDERDRIFGQVMQRAIREARQLGRSAKCGAGVWVKDGERYDVAHAGEPGGCRNDGSSCICECHDPAPGGEGEATP